MPCGASRACDVRLADATVEGLLGDEAHAELEPQLHGAVEELDPADAELGGPVERAPAPVHEEVLVEDREVEGLAEVVGQRGLARAGGAPDEDGEGRAVRHGVSG